MLFICRITVLTILAINAGVVAAMNNYDDPRIEKGFVNFEAPGSMDLVKLTMQVVDNHVHAKIYLRSIPSPSGDWASENKSQPGYFFELDQEGVLTTWLLTIRGEDVSIERLVSRGSGELDYTRNSVAEVTATVSGKVISLEIPVDKINFSKSLSYNLKTVEYHHQQDRLSIVNVWDSSNRFRKGDKTINPIHLFNRLCTGRA